MKMKKSNVVTAIICAIAISLVSYYNGVAAASTSRSSSDIDYNSQGKIVFTNGTDNVNDDVIFDAADFQKIDNMVSGGKLNIKAELDKYDGISTSDFPTFDELAGAIDNIAANTNAASGNLLVGKKALVNKSIIVGSMPDNSGKTKDAGDVTQDDKYTYFSIPDNGYYDTKSQIRTLNSNLPPEIKVIKGQSDPVSNSWIAPKDGKIFVHIGQPPSGATQVTKINVNTTSILSTYPGPGTNLMFDIKKDEVLQYTISGVWTSCVIFVS